MKYLSVCSGIEAATVAWHPLGWEPLAFSEIESFPRKVLAHHYPDVPCHGDFTILRDQDWIVDADLLVGGTPCQAFSVAGLRQSLSDDRGNLTLEFVRLADAIDNLRRIRGDKPAVIVWENVPGVLSVQDNAFGCFLAALVGNDAPLVPTGGRWTNAGLVVGPKRSAAWRVLDAQYFGVAQRRRRVFVVAGSGDGFDPAEILFEREGMRRDTAPSRKAGERAAPTVTNGPPFSRTGNDRVETEAIVVAKTPTSGTGQRYDSETDNFVVGALGARTGRSKGVQDATVGHMIVHGTQDPCVSDIAFAQGRNNGGENVLVQPYSIMPMNSGKDFKARETDVAQPLMTSQVGGNQGGDYVVQPMIFGVGEEPDVGHCLRSGASKADKHESTTYVAQPIAIHPHCIGRSATAGPQGKEYLEDGSAYTMDGTGKAQAVVQPIAFSSKDYGNDATSDLSPTLRAMPHSGSHANGGGQMAVAQPVAYASSDGIVRPLGDVMSTLDSARESRGSAQQRFIHQQMAVRRLTPRECERLQGFPDDYTDIPKAADGPRYKALGNSMAVPVMRWIGQRVQKHILPSPSVI